MATPSEALCGCYSFLAIFLVSVRKSYYVRHDGLEFSESRDGQNVELVRLRVYYSTPLALSDWTSCYDWSWLTHD